MKINHWIRERRISTSQGGVRAFALKIGMVPSEYCSMENGSIPFTRDPEIHERMCEVLSIDSLPMAEMHPASFWICDNCGNDSFVRLIRPSSEGLPEGGEWLMVPNEVTCSHCGEEYTTI